MANSYIVVEQVRDGEFEYYELCIVTLGEGKEPSEEAFLRHMYDDVTLTYDDFCRAWQLEGDYRLFRVYHYQLIESEEHKQILNKYGVH
jgi:predicted transcriptional regulator